MKYEIKHRYWGKVLFSAEVGSLKLCVEAAVSSHANLFHADLSQANLSHADLPGADLSGANLFHADLSGADLFRANLFRANLSHANLSQADLSHANLSQANLSGAKIRDGIEIQKRPIQIYGAYWDVTIWDEHMQIGCEFHSINDWFGFDDRTINAMNSHALRFWRHWKDPLMGICVAEKRWGAEQRKTTPKPDVLTLERDEWKRRVKLMMKYLVSGYTYPDAVLYRDDFIKLEPEAANWFEDKDDE